MKDLTPLDYNRVKSKPGIYVIRNVERRFTPIKKRGNFFSFWLSRPGLGVGSSC
jgi:hypothetical protein